MFSKANKKGKEKKYMPMARYVSRVPLPPPPLLLLLPLPLRHVDWLGLEVVWSVGSVGVWSTWLLLLFVVEVVGVIVVAKTISIKKIRKKKTIGAYHRSLWSLLWLNWQWPGNSEFKANHVSCDLLRAGLNNCEFFVFKVVPAHP